MFRKISIFALVISFELLLWATSAQGASTLTFPRVAFDSETLTGIAFVNPNAQDAVITLTVYGPDGLLIQAPGFQNPVDITVKGGEQLARLLDELFGGTFPADKFGWMLATTPADGVTGFFLYLNGALSLFDGADLPILGRKLVFNEIREDDDFTTELNVINPGSAASTLQLSLVRPGTLGTQVIVTDDPVPAMGMFRLDLKALFELETIPSGSYLIVTADVSIAGFEFIRSVEGKDLLGLNARPATEAQRVLYFPQMAVLGPWETRLGVVNYTNNPIIISVFAYKPDGTLHSGAPLQGSNPAVVPLGANEAINRDVAELFGFTGTTTLDGWLKVEATEPAINGFVSYGVTAAGSLAAVASQSITQNRALFSHIATTFGYFTGLALLNSGQLANDYRILASQADGESLGVFDGVLQPGERVSKLITEFIPASQNQGGGFIWVKSRFPIYMTSLFGTSSILANIPPQEAPEGYNPDAAQTSLRIQPSLAVVQPSRTTQFTATGAQSPTWKVNGVAGGNSTLGTISSSGLYTAPGAVPDSLPVTISAQKNGLAGGASVDVLTKEVLVAGVGIVQAVTYLSGLQKLYTAEIDAIGVSSGTKESLADNDSTVYSVLPGARQEIVEFPNETASKMISFTSSTGQEFLLMSSSDQGHVRRIDPQTGQSQVVISGLNSPNSMVFDPATGNLLVADKDFISSYTRNELEAGLQVTAQSKFRDPPVWALPEAELKGGSREFVRTGGPTPHSLRPKAVFESVQDARGVAVDACTGNLYVVQANGKILEIDPISAERRTLGPLESGGEALALYRQGVPCPDAFQLLVTSPVSESAYLVDPRDNTLTHWLGDREMLDLALLPGDNAVSDSAGVLFGEADMGSPSQVSLVPTPGLYDEDQPDSTGTQPFGGISDPRGDTYGLGPNQIDLLEVTSRFEEVDLVISLDFAEPVTPAWQGLGNSLLGFIDFDTDQNPLTGESSLVDFFSPYATNLGVDFFVALRDLQQGSPEIPVHRSGSEEPIAQAFVEFSEDGRRVNVFIPLDALDDDGRLDFAVVVGPPQEPTDAAPNGGSITSGVLAR